MIKAAIFDMDGVLIDSEPLWQEAEKKVFATVGLNLTTEMCLETMGVRIEEVVEYWFHKRRWIGKSRARVADEILSELTRLIAEKGEAMSGVDYILDFFRRRNIRLGLATSSSSRVIRAVLRKIDLEDVFEVVHSAEFETAGKPDPAIYVSTLRNLGLAAEQAIAFEDSYNGLLSARGASLRSVAIPEPGAWSESKFDIADIKLRSLSEFTDRHLEILENSK